MHKPKPTPSQRSCHSPRPSINHSLPDADGGGEAAALLPCGCERMCQVVERDSANVCLLKGSLTRTLITGVIYSVRHSSACTAAAPKQRGEVSLSPDLKRLTRLCSARLCEFIRIVNDTKAYRSTCIPHKHTHSHTYMCKEVWGGGGLYMFTHIDKTAKTKSDKKRFKRLCDTQLRGCAHVSF